MSALPPGYALTDDPARIDVAAAHAYLARALSLHSRSAGLEWSDSAAASARRAIELRPDEPDGYSALGETLRESGRYEEALVQYRRALAIDPNHSATIAEVGESNSYYGLGNLDQSIRWLVRAIELDPVQPWIYSVIVENYIRLGDLERAQAWIDRLDRALPGNSYSPSDRATLAQARGDRPTYERLAAIADSVAGRSVSARRLSRITALLYFGDFDAARAVSEEWLADSDDTPPAAVAVAIGRFDRARAVPWADSIDARERAKSAGRSRYRDIPTRLARTALVRGDRSGAIEHLEEWSRRAGPALYLLRSREWDALRTDPRFQALERDIVARADSMRANLARERL